MNGSDASVGHVTYLTDILGARVSARGKKIGRLWDLIIAEAQPFPEVTKILVKRPFGEPRLLIPWEKVKLLKRNEIVVSIEGTKEYETELQPADILLKDHILDKKVIDMEDREIEIVYDVKMLAKGNRLLVTDVNISHYRFLRRLGIKWIANLYYSVFGRDKDRKIPWQYIQSLPPNLGSFTGDVKLTVLKEALKDFHPADLADIIEELDSGQRVAIFNQLEPETASDTLEEIEPQVQRDLVPALKKEHVAQLLSTMTSGQAADILSSLPHVETHAILQALRAVNPKHERKISSILEHQEEKIAHFSTTKIFSLPQETSVTDAREHFNHTAKDLAVILYVYVTDEAGRLVGVMNLKEFLQAKEEAQLRDVMVDNVISLKPSSTLKEALDFFSRYDFRALPVIDEDGKLTGAVPYRDVMKLKHKFLE